MNRLRVWLFDVINGIRSGIPPCCIYYFVTTPFSIMVPNNEHNLKIQYQRCMKCRATGHAIEIELNGCVAHWLMPTGPKDLWYKEK